MMQERFQSDSKFSVHVRNKLTTANKYLHILRTLRKEGYDHLEIDLLFNTNITYALAGRGRVLTDVLSAHVQCRCHCHTTFKTPPTQVGDDHLLNRSGSFDYQF